MNNKNVQNFLCTLARVAPVTQRLHRRGSKRVGASSSEPCGGYWSVTETDWVLEHSPAAVYTVSWWRKSEQEAKAVVWAKDKGVLDQGNRDRDVKGWNDLRAPCKWK